MSVKGIEAPIYLMAPIGEGEMSDQQKNISEKDIANVIKGIKFGSVEITIHDSKVVQVERKEKIRAINSREFESGKE